jgi:hypothetical protein
VKRRQGHRQAGYGAAKSISFGVPMPFGEAEDKIMSDDKREPLMNPYRD